MSDIKTLTDRELDAEIAKTLGWKEGKHGWYSPGCSVRGFSSVSPPSFSTDSNAIHEAESILTDIQQWNYITELEHFLGLEDSPVWNNCNVFAVAHASVRQKAEALLLTLRGEDV